MLWQSGEEITVEMVMWRLYGDNLGYSSGWNGMVSGNNGCWNIYQHFGTNWTVQDDTCDDCWFDNYVPDSELYNGWDDTNVTYTMLANFRVRCLETYFKNKYFSTNSTRI